MDKYQNFSVDDFLQDDFFCEWVKTPNPNNIFFWQTWLDRNRDMCDVVAEAKEILLVLGEQYVPLPDAFYQRLKQRIDVSVGVNKQKETGFYLLGWLQVAAIIAAVACSIFLLLPTKAPAISATCSSSYGETKKVLLPDGSEVVLNANSTIRFAQNNNSKREVWLKGEAFFHVKHIEAAGQPASRFIVHAGKVNVEVLGTQFNIDNYTSMQTEVLLTSGKVKLSVAEQPQVITMKPDEKVLYSSKAKQLIVSKVDPANYVAWVEHKYIFEKTSLKDLCKELQRFYGKNFIVPDVKMQKQRLSGTLELQNEDTLIQTLSILLASSVRREGNEVVIGSK